MGQGLQVFDSSGSILSDTSTIVVKSTVLIPVNTPGSVTVNPPAGVSFIASSVSNGDYSPIVNVSGNSVSWSKPAGASRFSGAVQIMLY